MTNYPEPLRPTIDDLNPESATTDALVTMVRRHREGEDYPTAEVLLGNLPQVLRALCDHRLSGEATALDVAYRIASLINAIEGCRGKPEPPRRTPPRRKGGGVPRDATRTTSRESAAM
jgi:hypothetical protein